MQKRIPLASYVFYDHFHLLLSGHCVGAGKNSSYSNNTFESRRTTDRNVGGTGAEERKLLAGYFELAGNGVQLSYNLDARFFKHLSLKMGFGAYAENSGDFPILITMAHYLFFEQKFHIEMGIGSIIELNRSSCGSIVLPNSCSAVKGTAFLGIRYQPYWQGFTFRIGYTPFFSFDEYRGSAGVSLGYTFF